MQIMREIFVTRPPDAPACVCASEGVSPSHGRELFQFLALNGAIWCILKGLFFLILKDNMEIYLQLYVCGPDAGKARDGLYKMRETW